MDTPQPPPIVNQTLKRKERSPSPARRTPGHTSTAGSRPSPTSLPSIRHFLPQPDTAQLNERYHLTNNRQQTGPAFSAGPSAGIPRLDFLPLSPAQPPAERTHSGIIGDSDGDGDSEQAARPKQKRRRQALSCTGQFSPFPRSLLTWQPSDITCHHSSTLFSALVITRRTDFRFLGPSSRPIPSRVPLKNVNDVKLSATGEEIVVLMMQ
jgi:hypothetical protein